MENKLFDVYSKYAITIDLSKGCYLFDKQGKEYIDLYGGHGVISIGHGHPHYVETLKKQLDKIVFYSNSIEMPLQEELAEKLTTISGYTNYSLFLCNSGAEANENALKLASFKTGKKSVIAFNNSFHGRTAAAINVTYNQKIAAPINKNNYPVYFLELNDEQSFIETIQKEDIAAVIIEGIQGVGGLDMPSESFLQLIEKECKKNNVVLILDEIQSGYGRTGQFFAHQHAGIKADLITIAKGMGNGFPIGGVLISPDFEAKKGLLGTTFGGNHFACAAAIAVLDVIKQENLIENAAKMGSYFQNTLKDIDGIVKIKGKGLMMGTELAFPISDLRNSILFNHGIFTGNSDNPNVIRILPPLNVTTKEIDLFLKAFQMELAPIL